MPAKTSSWSNENPSEAFAALRSAIVSNAFMGRGFDVLPDLLAATRDHDAPYVLLLLADESGLQKAPYLDQILDRVPAEVLNRTVGPTFLNPHADTVPLWFQVYRRMTVPYILPGALSFDETLDRFVAHGADLSRVANHPSLTTSLAPRLRHLAKHLERAGLTAEASAEAASTSSLSVNQGVTPQEPPASPRPGRFSSR